MGLFSSTFLEGRRLNDDEEELLWERVAAVQAALSALARSSVPDPLRPWDAPGAVRLDQMTVCEWLDQSPSLQEASDETRDLGLNEMWLREWFEQHLQNEFGVPTSRISMLALLTQLAGHGDDFWSQYEVYRCADGAQALAVAMAERLGSAVSLSCPVHAIDITADGVSVTAKNTVEHADAVVLAVPPTVWDRIVVTPSLPQGYQIQMGMVVKYIAHVSRRFWISQGHAPDATHESIGSLWEPTDQQSGPDRMALAVFAEGPLAARAIAAADRDAFYAPHLEAVLPGFAQHRVSSRFCSWPEERWTGGGYSCPAPGQITGAMRRLCSEPWAGRLFFAGEHTSPRFFGFMEGAIRSGERVSEQIHLCTGEHGLTDGLQPSHPEAPCATPARLPGDHDRLERALLEITACIKPYRLPLSRTL